MHAIPRLYVYQRDHIYLHRMEPEGEELLKKFSSIAAATKYIVQKHRNRSLITKKDPITGNYSCRVCGVCFASGQALGGHRSRNEHEKDKIERTRDFEVLRGMLAASKEKMKRKRDLKHPSTKMLCDRTKYCCRICNKNFASGQALGGHRSKQKACGHYPMHRVDNVKRMPPVGISITAEEAINLEAEDDMGLSVNIIKYTTYEAPPSSSAILPVFK
eukprot:GILK01009414.1.p1 GENE.GILK01009414.1~~GILK01009414.1.p1  ORF type:complete len:240 (+),score=19.59 GILK01009414.1:71-721(+)